MTLPSTHSTPVLHPISPTQITSHPVSIRPNHAVFPSYLPTLLGVPPEIRLQIYTQYFKDITIFDAPSVPSSVIGLPPQRWQPPSQRWTPSQESRTMRPMTNLFLVCKQIKTEAATVFYQTATLGFVGCDMLTALAGRTKLFLNLRTILFGNAQVSTANPMGAVSSMILDLTHTSSETGQWAEKLPHELVISIFRRLLRSTPKLRRLKICIDRDRYDIFDSRHILSCDVLWYLCKFGHLTHFDISIRHEDKDESPDMILALKALNWVFNRHFKSEHLGEDTSGFDLYSKGGGFGLSELRFKVVTEMLAFEELKADKQLVRRIERQLNRLNLD